MAKDLIILYEDLKNGKMEFFNKLELLNSSKTTGKLHDLDNLKQYNHQKDDKEVKNSKIDKDGFIRICKKSR